MRRFSASHFCFFGLLIFALVMVWPQSAQAQTFTVLHNFARDADGGSPLSGVTIDKAGNLYGTTFVGGSADYGTVFKLSQKGSGWTLNVLYSFTGGNDGALPYARVIIGPNGILYGTTYNGGGGNCGGGCGTVFNLRPPARACKTALCPWTETVLYRFTGGSDGFGPLGDLLFDQGGNLYGTTQQGGGIGCGGSGCGAVYELSPSGSGWTEKVLYRFTGGADGSTPGAGVIFDQSGNLYGTTEDGASGYGVVYGLKPSESGWTGSVLYTFQNANDGALPDAGLLFDTSGDLYGATSSGGMGGGGTVYQLVPFNGSWAFNVLYPLNGSNGPYGSLTMDVAGNLYGSTNNPSTVFKLTPGGNGWVYTDLHDLIGADGTGGGASVSLDKAGNLYGTTIGGGAYGYGVIWEITP